MAAGQAGRAAERAARDSYGHLLAYLATRSRDVAGSGDALAEAFASALDTWPRTGVPENPDGWLSLGEQVSARCPERLVVAQRWRGHEIGQGVELGDVADAREALRIAASLSTDPVLRQFLLGRLQALTL